MMHFKKILLFSLLFLGVASTAYSYGRTGRFQAGAGAGLAFHSPVRFDLNVNGQYFFWENVSVGMNFDVLLRGPATFVFIPFARYHFDIMSAPRWTPYVGAGVGASVNTNGNGLLDIMVPNLGVTYEAIADRLFVGTDLAPHVLTNFDRTTWDFRWLIVTASYRF